MEQLKIKIYGSVQGVGFRSFVKRNADELGIKGYVRNSDDGSVLVIAQSNRDELEKFLSVVRQGPISVRVERFLYEWRDSDKNYESFDIILNNSIKV